jgi:hypothetical protein
MSISHGWGESVVRVLKNQMAPIARTKAETEPTNGHGLGLTRW